VKPLTEFHRRGKNGTQGYCKPCVNAASVEYTARHPGSRRKAPRTAEQRRREKQHPRRRTPEQRARRNAVQRDYRIKNAAKVRMWNKLRLHRQRGGGPMPEPAVMGAMLCEQEAQCTYCRAVLGASFHIDHKTPVSRDGGNEEANLQLLCPACNIDKRARTHEEYLAVLAARAVL
jgi:5-methylcytosine-specific restriction endonuclease McrA